MSLRKKVLGSMILKPYLSAKQPIAACITLLIASHWFDENSHVKDSVMALESVAVSSMHA